jgi:hypothetical protein
MRGKINAIKRTPKGFNVNEGLIEPFLNGLTSEEMQDMLMLDEFYREGAKAQRRRQRKKKRPVTFDRGLFCSNFNQLLKHL